MRVGAPWRLERQNKEGSFIETDVFGSLEGVGTVGSLQIE